MRTPRRIPVAVLTAGVMLAAGGCAYSQVHPSISEYAITTSHGTFSNQDVIHVTQPGQNVKLGSGTTTWYFPATVQPYITGLNGDRVTPTAEFTGVDPKQANSAISVHVYTYVGFEVNPAITKDTTGMAADGATKIQWAFATHFLRLCLRYACATGNPQNVSALPSQERSSDPGWLNLMDGLFPRAIDNATRSALVQFPPGIWQASGEAQWPALADKIAANLSSELQALDGSAAEGQADYFCGPGSTVTKCMPFLVQISAITPTDTGVLLAYQQQQQAAYASEAAAARLALAKRLYGPDANWTLSMLDIVTKCQQEKVPCNFYLGQAPIHP